MIVLVVLFLAVADGAAVTESYKNQYCTDPRTMRKHAAYTEWADAYSCTRHRCQPGGRNLAIYTVGCKRVEAPESAIECEEVVEDTNMQFPFCCTRLRCLVVVRGEVWTRVLGQPWESLPAAPWSHMYKMKKPPPADGAFTPKSPEQGPVYELTDSDSDGPREKVLRANQGATRNPDSKASSPRALQAPPDIVIALSTHQDSKMKPLEMNLNMLSSGSAGGRHKRKHKGMARANDFEEELERDDHTETDVGEIDDTSRVTDKPMESDERFYGYPLRATQKVFRMFQPETRQSWTEIPQNQWNDPSADVDNNEDNPSNQQDFSDQKNEDKPPNLQALVDAIGSRMRDIENVVQRMSEKVQQPGDDTGEKGDATEDSNKRHKSGGELKESGKTKKPGNDEHYKRFTVRNRSSKYVYATDSTTEKPLFVDDANMHGYFSDASNSVLRRASGPKMAAQTYMAPVETRRQTNQAADVDEEKKHKKHQHKKKKGKHHKKHHSKKRMNRLSSAEVDKNMVSLEDSSALGT